MQSAGEGRMTEFGRRDFLKGAVAGGVATTSPLVAEAQAQAPAPAAPAAAAPSVPGYAFLNLDEAAFVEDRALAGAWGKGDRLYMQGPWKPGVPSQGYQSPLTPAQLYRAGIEATNAHCRKTYGKTFDRLTEQQREEVLVGLSTAKIAFENGLPVRPFWAMLYQTVMEGMFSDPIYGGNRDKAGWKLIGFPGAIAVHRENIEKYKDKKFPTNPISISDMS
jgi:gluconate 2-dehydrogenase gamma chain